ncbi:MAG: glycoside hydrolase family 30 protein [Hymenobacter sp.]|nr:glycoside hydrolase family 30 protein [Hymenobacter sp.]
MQVHTTAQNDPQRFKRTPAPAGSPSRQPFENEIAVLVDLERRYQTLLGIGGAITDASAEVWSRLPQLKQAELLDAYFGRERGLGYSLLRTTIHSSDFSSASYTYVAEGDQTLASFDIAPDRRHRLPMIRAALKAAGGTLTTYVSPWSAPAWMKDNHSMLQGGKLRPEMAGAWARYMARFIATYEAEGVPVWGLTVQNEPMATQRWESMIYTAEEERDFLKNHLGPALRDAGLGDRKIIVWDHNRDLMTHRAQVILSDPEAARYVWGIGFHWYETWAGGEPMHRNVAAVRDAWPNVNLLLTEATVEGFDPTRLQSWPNAERYGRQMIEDFNAGAVGWTDWNILLDERGGPNHVGNFCFAPIIGDTKVGKLLYTNAYYYIGHFSKFIRPGARRIVSSVNRDALQATAFRNSDGSVVVVMNQTDKALDFQLWLAGQSAKATAAAHSIMTIVQ